MPRYGHHCSLAVELIKVICRKAAENTTAVMPGYTHLQRAQPITFGHALMAYASMLLRDLQRFEDATARMDAQCPLGSGALAGTTYPLDRQFTAEKLGFAAPCANSLDGVSDRDFCISIDKVCVWLSSAAGEVYVCENAAYHSYSEDEAAKVLAEHDILVKVDMGTGDASAKAWGCDLTYDYVKINGDGCWAATTTAWSGAPTASAIWKSLPSWPVCP